MYTITDAPWLDFMLRNFEVRGLLTSVDFRSKSELFHTKSPRSFTIPKYGSKSRLMYFRVHKLAGCKGLETSPDLDP